MKKFLPLIFAIVIILLLVAVFILLGYFREGLTEKEARKIAEQTCIKGGESLGSVTYDSSAKIWTYTANLNTTKENCSSVCEVSESSKKGELIWICKENKEEKEDEDETPEVSTNETIRQLFAAKYPQTPISQIKVTISKETANHMRGSVMLGNDGGIFLATKINGSWQIVHDGHGVIPCSLSQYNFPADMLSDCYSGS